MAVLPKEVTTSIVPAPTEPPADRQPGLSLSSLFENNLVPQRDEPSPLAESTIGYRLASILGDSPDIQREIEMRNDFGYSPKQIAEDLNLTVGEVELRISLRN